MRTRLAERGSSAALDNQDQHGPRCGLSRTGVSEQAAADDKQVIS
jgi:hypothetical protein